MIRASASLTPTLSQREREVSWQPETEGGVARGGAEEKEGMRLAGLGVLAALLLSGCASINDMLVRQMFKDWGVSRQVRGQIQKGLERRRETAPAGPKELAPPFMDLG